MVYFYHRASEGHPQEWQGDLALLLFIYPLFTLHVGPIVDSLLFLHGTVMLWSMHMLASQGLYPTRIIPPA